MKRGCWVCRVINLVLVAALVGLAYLIVVPGNIEPHADGRSVVLLNPDERNKVLGEMRGLLETVQAVVQAATMGDMEAVSVASTAAGMAAARGESGSLLGKLPLEFLALGMGTHKAFDALAVTAQETDDPMVILEELGVIMDNCTGCHAGYRLGIEGQDREQ